MKSIVVAFDKQRGIGANNDLLWLRDLPADLKHFKDLTTAHAIVMGRNTFDSIGRPLPNRQNIVVSLKLKHADGVDVVHSLDEAFAQAKDSEIFVIGGARIYEEAINMVDQIYATEVNETFPQATVFFPPIDPTVWREIEREHWAADEANKYSFDFVRYVRI